MKIGGNLKGYNFLEIEQKWQRYWDTEKTFVVTEDPSFPPEKRKYILDMFPYPSAAGLHVGHPEGYTATDIYCRYLRMRGYNVLHPMGFDSFGLPAENYAIQTGTHPSVSTTKNIDRFRKQIKRLGLSYDWSREVSTHQPSYYKWTQWIFLQLYKQGLAYQEDIPVWFCQELGTVLANEEVLITKNGPRSERGNHPVVRKKLRQWMLRITAYAERLLSDLDTLDWPESIKSMQRNWIGKSHGTEVVFALTTKRPDEAYNKENSICVFTTRVDTIFGASYLVLAPEHPLVSTITKESQTKEVTEYQKRASLKSDLERGDLSKQKTGVFTGSYATNPLTNTDVPIWISDYVMLGYGTGAIMAVPSHDTRDLAFARTYKLPLCKVVEPYDTPEASTHASASSSTDFSVNSGTDPSANPSQEDTIFTGDGKLINSGQFTGLSSAEARKKITQWLSDKAIGTHKVQYKLRDWIFSRQRYWGEPIPLYFLQDGSIVPLQESDLPLTLPQVDSYRPAGTGESPLAAIDSWKTIALSNNEHAHRETNTMPQWAGSCWYYLRYTDPHNADLLADQKNIAYWLPVDLYVGGAEHAVLHLLYARFWHKVLYDLKIVPTSEPFLKLINQGMILGEDGNKMSKSLGNVVNPDELLTTYGADAFRMYEMFMGPLNQEKPWSTQGLKGLYRFLNKVWSLTEYAFSTEPCPTEVTKATHKTLYKVTHDIESFSYNTAIAHLMSLVTLLLKQTVRFREEWELFILMLSPFAPHIAEELWSLAGHTQSLAYHPWPQWKESYLKDDDKEIVFQVNGKVRSKARLASDLPESELEAHALADKRIKTFIADKAIKKIIVVKNKLVNIVAS